MRVIIEIWEKSLKMSCCLKQVIWWLMMYVLPILYWLCWLQFSSSLCLCQLHNTSWNTLIKYGDSLLLIYIASYTFNGGLLRLNLVWHFFLLFVDFQVTWCSISYELKNQDKKFAINVVSALMLPMLRLTEKIIFFVNIWRLQTSSVLIVRRCSETDLLWIVTLLLVVNNKDVLTILI